MSRSGYVDDCEGINLYRGSVERALRGKRGQKFLRELAAAMDAMPEKVLIANELVTTDGDACALGAVCKSRGMDHTKIDYECPDAVGKALGIARSMAAEIEYMNDEWDYHESPENRWLRMRKWVDDRLVKPEGE